MKLYPMMMKKMFHGPTSSWNSLAIISKSPAHKIKLVAKFNITWKAIGKIIPSNAPLAKGEI